MIETVEPDTSFYLCYHDDINMRDFLDVFLDSYSFHLGPRILNELPAALSKSDMFQKNIVNPS